MISNYKLISIVLCCMCLSCTSSKMKTSPANVLPATSLQPYGRYLINKDNNVELISSAVHFGFSFHGEKCSLYASVSNSNGHNYLQYELDGVYQKRIKISGSNSQPVML